jgi:hypothetical protein
VPLVPPLAASFCAVDHEPLVVSLSKVAVLELSSAVQPKIV